MKILTVPSAKEEIRRLQNFINLVDSYGTDTLEKWITKEYGYTEKRQINANLYQVKTRNRLGGTVRTNVFKKDGLFKAFSYYNQDEDEAIVGYVESNNDEQAVKCLRKELRR